MEDPGSGRDPAAALFRRKRTTLLIDRARSQQQDLVCGTTRRSIEVCATRLPPVLRASLLELHSSATLQNLLVVPCRIGLANSSRESPTAHLQMTDKIDKLENNDAHLVIDCRSLSGSRRQCQGGHRARPHFRFQSSASRSKEQMIGSMRSRGSRGRRTPPRLQPGETHCAAVRGARPAEGRRTALFIDLAPWQQQNSSRGDRTSDHSMGEDRSGVRARSSRDFGRRAVPVEGPNRQARKCLRSSSNCPPARGLLANCPGGRDALLIPISVVLLRAPRNGLLGTSRIAYAKRRPDTGHPGTVPTVNAVAPGGAEALLDSE